MREERIARIEQRLARVEDELAIYRLLATYGPLADAGLGEQAAALWVDEGIYHPGGLAPAQGRAALIDIYNSPNHQHFVRHGSMHMTAPVRIDIDGDTAEAVGYSLLALNDGANGFRLLRAGINHWTFARTSRGWRIVERLNRVLDGSPEAQALLAKADR